MKELISLQQMETILRGVLLLGIVIAVASAFWANRRGADPVTAAVAAGVPPLLLYGLWRVYNVITGALGLDRVINLVVNAVVFVVVGALCGLGWAWLTARRASGESK